MRNPEEHAKERSGNERATIRVGDRVEVVLKEDQKTGKRTRGEVKELLTKSRFHPHGIKVRLIDGQVGRVKRVIANEE